MIRLSQLVKSANTLHKIAQSSFEGQDLKTTKSALSSLGELIDQLEKFAKDHANKEICSERISKSLKYSKESQSIYGPHKWFNSRW